MRVSIPIEFEVEAVDDADGELTEVQAKDAAEQAVLCFLSFDSVITGSTQVIEAHADGFGKCFVQIKAGV